MKLAILGGSFNPVHNGHLALADDVRLSLGFDRILLVPANIPPHKVLSGGATAADRLAMLEFAAAGVPWLGVEDCELARGGVSYTIDTVRYLEQKWAGSLEGKIGLVVGADLVSAFTTWKDAEQLASLADIILARRPLCVDQKSGIQGATGETGVSGETGSSGFPYPCRALDNPLLPISSSGIRERIAAGKSWRYLVPDPVYRYIVGHKLYEY